MMLTGVWDLAMRRKVLKSENVTIILSTIYIELMLNSELLERSFTKAFDCTKYVFNIGTV